MKYYRIEAFSGQNVTRTNSSGKIYIRTKWGKDRVDKKIPFFHFLQKARLALRTKIFARFSQGFCKTRAKIFVAKPIILEYPDKNILVGLTICESQATF